MLRLAQPRLPEVRVPIPEWTERNLVGAVWIRAEHDERSESGKV